MAGVLYDKASSRVYKDKQRMKCTQQNENMTSRKKHIFQSMNLLFSTNIRENEEFAWRSISRGKKWVTSLNEVIIEFFETWVNWKILEK